MLGLTLVSSGSSSTGYTLHVESSSSSAAGKHFRDALGQGDNSLASQLLFEAFEFGIWLLRVNSVHQVANPLIGPERQPRLIPGIVLPLRRGRSVSNENQVSLTSRALAVLYQKTLRTVTPQ